MPFVKMAVCMAGADIVRAPGDVVEVTEEVRDAWVKEGIAVDHTPAVAEVPAPTEAEFADARPRSRR
jgi:hypothetical protein